MFVQESVSVSVICYILEKHIHEILSPTLLVSPDRFSGITPAMLQPVTTTLQDVQEMLIRILPHEAVLVGHSLEHDLIALKVSDFFQTF